MRFRILTRKNPLPDLKECWAKKVWRHLLSQDLALYSLFICIAKKISVNISVYCSKSLVTQAPPTLETKASIMKAEQWHPSSIPMSTLSVSSPSPGHFAWSALSCLQLIKTSWFIAAGRQIRGHPGPSHPPGPTLPKQSDTFAQDDRDELISLPLSG